MILAMILLTSCGDESGVQGSDPGSAEESKPSDVAMAEIVQLCQRINDDYLDHAEVFLVTDGLPDDAAHYRVIAGDPTMLEDYSDRSIYTCSFGPGELGESRLIRVALPDRFVVAVPG